MHRNGSARILVFISFLFLALLLVSPAIFADAGPRSHGANPGWGRNGPSAGLPFSLSRMGTTFYFAEGTTRPGFEEWLTVQNPSDHEADLEITYMRGDGNTDVKEHVVAPQSRKTISVNSEIGSGDSEAYDVSVMIESLDGVGIVAERPIYFNYKGQWAGG